jgi:NAD(P)H-hydrate repair Nnr-like enzyme with NAD(P)H-hydrate epimerase domain
VIAIVTPDDMRAVDAAAAEPTDVLVRRAGSAVARAAVRMMGGTYGRTVVVLAGGGNNGADGRVAAEVLASKGVRVHVFDAADCPAELPFADLVIDAAYGTGFRGTWNPPAVGDTPVLAVDLPSGVNGAHRRGSGCGAAGHSHGHVRGAEARAVMLGPGSQLAGAVELVDIGFE